jgi:hypothetical protein
MQRSTIAPRAVRRLAVAAALALPACIEASPNVTIEGGVYAPTLSGNIGLGATVATDVDTIDLDSSLDLGKTEYVPYLRGEFAIAGLDLSLSGFKTSQTGTGTVTADFGDITAGSTVDSKLDLALAHASLCYDVVDTKPFTFGAGIGADYFDLDMDVHNVAFGLDESVQIRQAIPLLVARGVVRTPVLPSGSSKWRDHRTRRGPRRHAHRHRGAAALQIVGPLAVYGGYRYVHGEFRAGRTAATSTRTSRCRASCSARRSDSDGRVDRSVIRRGAAPAARARRVVARGALGRVSRGAGACAGPSWLGLAGRGRRAPDRLGSGWSGLGRRARGRRGSGWRGRGRRGRATSERGRGAARRDEERESGRVRRAPRGSNGSSDSNVRSGSSGWTGRRASAARRAHGSVRGAVRHAARSRAG